MNARKIFTVLLSGMFLLLATVGFAADKASLHLFDPVTVNGKPLPGGDYTVTWEGSGPNVELKFVKGKDVVATSPAQLVNLTKAAAGSSVATKSSTSGAPALTQITFGGKKYALSLGEQTVQSADSSK
jgi:hypothetical protein